MDWPVWTDGLVDSSYGGLIGGGVRTGELVERTGVDCIMSSLLRTAKLVPGNYPSITV